MARPAVAPAHRWLAAVWVALVLGHYADVTTPALYGRDINLYWDVRYMPDVAAMIARAAPWWLLVGGARGGGRGPRGAVRLFRWAIGRVAAAGVRRERARAVFMRRR